MPQNLYFEIPVEPRYNPNHDYAERHNLDWLRAHHMLTTRRAEQMYLGWQIADLAARCWPDAHAEDLCLTVDLKSFYFLFDDQFDGPQGKDPSHVARICQKLIEVVHRDTAADSKAAPVVSAFADLWARSRDGMTTSWIARTSHDWERYFASYPYEAIGRHAGTIPDLDDYMVIRRGSAATESVTDMVERLNRIELPPIVFHGPQIRLMREIAADVPFICNDVFSYEKERGRGDVYNLVAVLCHGRQLSVEEAVGYIRTMVAARVSRFFQLRLQIPQILQGLDIAAADRATVTRYAEGLGDWLRGHNDWMSSTVRYRPAGAPPADQPGYLDELIKPSLDSRVQNQ
ncbi:hypothetical protein [Nocardia sp. NPDC052316]|uniref:terpene synthase family protein n=1 Tax=Nocardia sp. NPDC052316 TaxID=3364329 RepID=UPI0037CBE99A